MKKMMALEDILAKPALTAKWIQGKLDRAAAFEQAKTICSQIEACWVCRCSIAMFVRQRCYIMAEESLVQTRHAKHTINALIQRSYHNTRQRCISSPGTYMGRLEHVSVTVSVVNTVALHEIIVIVH